MRPYTLNCRRDEALLVDRLYQDGTGVAINITGWVAELSISKIQQIHGENTELVTVTEASGANGVVTIVGASGEAKARVNKAFMETVRPGQYLWNFWIAPTRDETEVPITLGWGLLEVGP